MDFCRHDALLLMEGLPPTAERLAGSAGMAGKSADPREVGGHVAPAHDNYDCWQRHKLVILEFPGLS
jgi:hypothetical protein